MPKTLFKLCLLALLIFIGAFVFIKTIQMLSGSDHFSVIDQVLCSMDLNDAPSQNETGDHPIIPSKAMTDLTKPNTKS
uniref:Female-specific orf protein n=1 Tax=Utterbackia peggyae TaxID=1009868 RepID=F4ZFR5_9BIVA|nr:female-specific orf protein [Utterbackia peggyae]AEC14149.1 female-specific orf protein [Utterbackia peggyae]AEC14151.1 female-specific orf protein [Utterbackia peggyae]AEC14152.1 female-specific orf protein [Utterbackia peggyae]AEC14153.1 female-specific orf protein [Utterbackia peggyae]